MSKFTTTWHEPNQRIYNSGVDRGMFFVGGVGYAWPGLTGVDRNAGSGEVSKKYLDGRLFAISASPTDYEASVAALHIPKELGACLGRTDPALHNGLTVHNQLPKMFDFTYRTLSGDGADGEYGEIHFVYNCVGFEQALSSVSINDSPEATPRTIDIHAFPQNLAGRRWTAYVSVDSRYTNVEDFVELERSLYGFEGTSATMPSMVDLVAILGG